MFTHVRRWLSHAAAVAVIVGLGAVAHAGLLSGHLTIVAPTSIRGGNPIIGFVHGGLPDTTVTGHSGLMGLQGSPDASGDDPNMFVFATLESMAPCVVNIVAMDFLDVAVASVFVY